MMKTLLVAATMATLITGHESRAQTITLDASSKMGRNLLCRQEWKAIKDDPKKIEVTQYGSQYFVKQCKQRLEAKLAGGR